jgi:hypothetical protein
MAHIHPLKMRDVALHFPKVGWQKLMRVQEQRNLSRWIIAIGRVVAVEGRAVEEDFWIENQSC